nr:putative capsid protein [Polycipiviridae sp.]
MADDLQPISSDPLFVQPIEEKPQSTANVPNSSNLIQNHQRLSMLAQIYNYQPTGTLIELHLPIINANNTPLFGLKISPLWIPAKFFMHDISTAFGSKRVDMYLAAKSWSIPYIYGPLKDTEIGAGISVTENDDMCDLSWWALSHFGWKGSISYQLRIISNVTTQGKVTVSRLYDQIQSHRYYDPTIYRTPFEDNNMIWPSQSQRRKNAFMYADFSRTSDLEIDCPWQSFNQFYPLSGTLNSNLNGYLEPMSYLWFDISGALAVSAAATTLTFEILIKAGDDFEFIYPMPPSQFMMDSTNYRSTAGSGNATPWIFGAGTNLTVTDENTMGLTALLSKSAKKKATH